MKKLVLVLSLFIGVNMYSQTDKLNETQRYKSYLINKSKKLVLDMSSYDKEFISNTYKFFSDFKNKVTSVEYDDSSKKMEITHNGLIKQEDMYELLKIKNISSTNIISYN